MARHTVYGELLRMDNLTGADAIEAILSVLPLDTFVDDFAARMEIVDAPDEVPPVQAEVQAVIDKAEGAPRPMVSVERFDFYDKAREAYAVDPDRRAPLLRLLSAAQGRDPAGRVRRSGHE